MNQQDNKQFDIGYFTLFDANTVIEPHHAQDDHDDIIMNKSAQNIHYMFNKLLEHLQQNNKKRQQLPEELQQHDFTKSIYNLKLPKGTTIFPRSRKIPKKRQQTKWEKFAQEKGIKKKKRSGKVFDEQTQRYLPRWGSKSKKNQLPPIMEQKQAGMDPFQKRSLQKKLRVSKQELRQEKNNNRNKKDN